MNTQNVFIRTERTSAENVLINLKTGKYNWEMLAYIAASMH